MKVLLCTYGTRGDVQPFVALARALNAAGHEALVAAPAAPVSSLAKPYGVRFAPLDNGVNRLLFDPVVRHAILTHFRGVGGKALAIRIVPEIWREMACMLEEIARVAMDYGPDLVAHQAIVPGHEIAEMLGVPGVPVCVQPVWIPTSLFPHPMVPFRVPPVLNRASYGWSRVRRLIWYRSSARWRRETLRLRRRRGRHNVLRRPDGGPATVLQAFSPQVLPAPMDYPEGVHTTGFWPLPVPPDWTPTPQLSDFLAAGDSPIYVGFGSSVGTDPIRTGRIVAEAIRISGTRAVVVAGWGGIPEGEPRDEVLYLDQAPLDWLFPRMAAIVHHGGMGTTGSALVAGVPQVCCPLDRGQQFFARRMHALGVAPAPQFQGHLTVAGLAGAIRCAVTDEALAERAREIGYRVRAEDGLTTAIETLESAHANAHSSAPEVSHGLRFRHT